MHENVQKWSSQEVKNNFKKKWEIWLQNGIKINNTSFHMLLDHCYASVLLLKPSSLKKKFVKKELAEK